VPSEPSPPTDRTRILIAGDDRRFSERLRVSIEAHEALQVVGIAATGDEALHLVETLKPSLVLMEAAIPGLDGIEAMRRMHGLPDGPAVLLMTADDEAEESRAFEAGAAAYLRKSADLVSLVDVVVTFARLSD
jgi:DNA-binding NarL/FixJ family response regulator